MQLSHLQSVCLQRKYPFVLYLYTNLTVFFCFVVKWVDHQQPVLHVLLIIVSFILAWGETWWFDFRVIPRETYTQRYLACKLNQSKVLDFVHVSCIIIQSFSELSEFGQRSGSVGDSRWRRRGGHVPFDTQFKRRRKFSFRHNLYA